MDARVRRGRRRRRTPSTSSDGERRTFGNGRADPIDDQSRGARQRRDGGYNAAGGSALDLPVDVVNQGFVTAPLEATLVGNAPAGVTVQLDPEALSGAPAEVRILRVTLTQPGQTDLTVAFRAHNEIPDLGGRDRVHFLVECRQQAD